MASDDLYFDDWNSGSDLAANSVLKDQDAGNESMWWIPLAQAGIQAAGKAMGTAPAGPSRADSITRSGFDSSNWVVNIGSGSVAQEKSDGDKMMQWALLAVGGILLWRMTRKSS